MSLPQDLKYSKEHEWVRMAGDVATIGITDHAQDALGDVVFVELPEVGSHVVAGASCGSIESVKAVSDLYAPVSGEVLEVNDTLTDSPETLNSDPYKAGWILKVRLANKADLDALLDAAGYQAHLG